MFTVVAPASIALSTTSARKSSSVRAASSGENSTSSHIVLGALDALDGPADDLFLGHLELEFAVDGAGGEEDVDARLRRHRCSASPGAVDVGVVAAGQAADDRPCDLAGDRLHRLEVAGRGDREARLDDVDAKVRQRVGDLQLLGEVHAGAGRLLAVAQGRVEDHYAVVGHK